MLIDKKISNLKNTADVVTRSVNGIRIVIDSEFSFIKFDYDIVNYKDDVLSNVYKSQKSSLTATNNQRVYVDESFKMTTDSTKTEIGLYDYFLTLAKNGVNIFVVIEQYIQLNDAKGTFDVY